MSIENKPLFHSIQKLSFKARKPSVTAYTAFKRNSTTRTISYSN